MIAVVERHLRTGLAAVLAALLVGVAALLVVVAALVAARSRGWIHHKTQPLRNDPNRLRVGKSARRDAQMRAILSSRVTLEKVGVGGNELGPTNRP